MGARTQGKVMVKVHREIPLKREKEGPVPLAARAKGEKSTLVALLGARPEV